MQVPAKGLGRVVAEEGRPAPRRPQGHLAGDYPKIGVASNRELGRRAPGFELD
jgi:hypothetical protein